MRQLRDIMAVKGYNKIMNEEILRQANLPSMADILIEKNLKWLGYVRKMEHSRLLRQLLYSQVKEGKRNTGRPRLRLKKFAKRNIKLRAINLSFWQQTADNRVAWRVATKFKPNP